MTSLLGD
uniref:Uncharacterized protein n=1 Tax=Oryza punctata TaxID=4537 RepID=A0A1Y8Z5T9_ORYPU